MRADKSSIEKKTLPTTTGVAAEPSLTTRLHISPFDADLLKVVVPAAVLPSARNVSFHTVETFPENRYGFVDLPTADAEKIRNKFNGSTLRGHKMRVEKARAEQIPTPTPDDDVDVENDVGKKRKKKSSDDKSGSSKRRKRDLSTIEGVLLPEGRKVKRGWTITQEEARKEKKKSKSKDKKDSKSKKAVKSKYTDKAECLMKVVLPPNAPLLADAKDSDKRNKKKRKSGKADREVVIHEFTNTTKFPSFLKLNPTPSVPKPAQAETGDPKASTPKPQKHEARDVASSSDSSSSSEDSDSSSDSEEEEDAADDQPVPDVSPQAKSGPEPASSADSPAGQLAAMSPSSARPKSSGSTKSLSITIPPASSPATPVPEKVHPLEALYKKTKPQGAAAETSATAEPFSFFGGGNHDEEDEDMEDDEPAPSSQAPMTPYTRQDFDQRNIRSAAPTPDTAHPKTRVFWAPDAANNLGEEDEGDSLPRGSVDREDADEKEGKQDVVPAGEFHSWFYDNRRELNKSWMSRRKTARKEKRQRDNRARASRS